MVFKYPRNYEKNKNERLNKATARNVDLINILDPKIDECGKESRIQKVMEVTVGRIRNEKYECEKIIKALRAIIYYKKITEKPLTTNQI